MRRRAKHRLKRFSRWVGLRLLLLVVGWLWGERAHAVENALSTRAVHPTDRSSAYSTDAVPMTRVAHWTEINVRRQVRPRFVGRSEMPPGTSVRCEARFVIDRGGVVLDVVPLACDAAHAETILPALARWRFEPLSMSDELQALTYDYVLIYRLG